LEVLTFELRFLAALQIARIERVGMVAKSAEPATHGLSHNLTKVSNWTVKISVAYQTTLEHPIERTLTS
jgi:hypothetical protein